MRVKVFGDCGLPLRLPPLTCPAPPPARTQGRPPDPPGLQVCRSCQRGEMGGTSEVLCRYHLYGACKLGSQCAFSHSLDNAESQVRAWGKWSAHAPAAAPTTTCHLSHVATTAAVPVHLRRSAASTNGESAAMATGAATCT